jgi:hypothetical protein
MKASARLGPANLLYSAVKQQTDSGPPLRSTGTNSSPSHPNRERTGNPCYHSHCKKDNANYLHSWPPPRKFRFGPADGKLLSGTLSGTEGRRIRSSKIYKRSPAALRGSNLRAEAASFVTLPCHWTRRAECDTAQVSGAVNWPVHIVAPGISFDVGARRRGGLRIRVAACYSARRK